MRFGSGRALITLLVFALALMLAIRAHSSLVGSIVQAVCWLTLGALSTAKLILIWSRRHDPARRAAAASAGSLGYMPSWLRRWILDESAGAGPTDN